MITSRTPREFHFRVVYKRAGRYAVALHVTFQKHGMELYVGETRRDDLEWDLSSRRSYHASGQRHEKLMVHHRGALRELERFRRTPGPSPANFVGKEELFGGPADDAVDWDYRPKSDSRTRETFTVPLDEGPTFRNTGLWLVEPGRRDLVEEILTNYPLILDNHGPLRPIAERYERRSKTVAPLA
jgi:hypothetical protein